MSPRKVVPFILLTAAVLGAAALGTWSGGDRVIGARVAPEPVEPGAPEPTREPETVMAPSPAPAGPIASHAIMGSENGEAPGLTWTVPSGWEKAPNPNSMRLATYRVHGRGPEDAVDVSVSRAGGTMDQNVERWVGQFAEDRVVREDDKQVQGLSVTVVSIEGTYLGGGMMPGAPAKPLRGWSMLAAIVPAPSGSAYFFKALGPSPAVASARPAFDAMLDSLSTR